MIQWLLLGGLAAKLIVDALSKPDTDSTEAGGGETDKERALRTKYETRIASLEEKEQQQAQEKQADKARRDAAKLAQKAAAEAAKEA